MNSLPIDNINYHQLLGTFSGHPDTYSNCWPSLYPGYPWPQPLVQPVVINNPPIIIERVIERAQTKIKRGQVFEDEAGKLHIFDGSKWITIDQETKSENESEAVSSL